MTLPAELRAERDRRVPGVNAYYHDESTRALLHRASDALELYALPERCVRVVFYDKDGHLIGGHKTPLPATPEG